MGQPCPFRRSGWPTLAILFYARVGHFSQIPLDNPVTTLVYYPRKEVRLAFRETPLTTQNLTFQETSMPTNRSVGRFTATQEKARSAATQENDRPAVTHKKDRSNLCAFTFADGRHCRTPRRSYT